MRITKFYFMLLTIVATTVFVGCSDDDDSDTMAQVSVDGTVLFDDGDEDKKVKWTNMRTNK